MKVIKDIIHLVRTGDTWFLDTSRTNMKRLAEESHDQFVKNPDADEVVLEMRITSVFQYKTSSQLGYLHAAVFPVFYEFYKDNGIEETQENIRTSLKLHDEVNFTEEHYNLFTMKTYVQPKSLASASKEETSEFIDKIIRLAARWSLHIEDPETYKTRMNLRKFTK